MKIRKGRYNLARSRQVAVIREKTPLEIRKHDAPSPAMPAEGHRTLATVLSGQFDDCSETD